MGTFSEVVVLHTISRYKLILHLYYKTNTYTGYIICVLWPMLIQFCVWVHLPHTISNLYGDISVVNFLYCMAQGDSLMCVGTFSVVTYHKSYHT